jgi:RimJ/RimL family protein N-acetyltransferase
MRPHRIDDFSALHATWSDADVVRFLGGKPLTREESWARLLRYVGHWTLLGYGMWAVETRDSSDYLGDIGFLDAKRDIDPPFHDTPEIGWVLASHAHGKGYATEAVHAALEWGDQHFSRDTRTVCIIHPDNLPSLRVAEKCGYRELHRTTYKNEPTIVLGRLA